MRSPERLRFKQFIVGQRIVRQGYITLDEKQLADNAVDLKKKLAVGAIQIFEGGLNGKRFNFDELPPAPEKSEVQLEVVTIEEEIGRASCRERV
jgi:hypothetical protein